MHKNLSCVVLFNRYILCLNYGWTYNLVVHSNLIIRWLSRPRNHSIWGLWPI